MKNYVGIACTGHDNALAFVDSTGNVQFAEANERYLQVKRGFGYTAEDWFRIKDLISKYTEPGTELVLALTWSDEAATTLSEERRLHEAAKLPQLTTAYRIFEQAANDAGQVATGVARQLGREVSVRRYQHHRTHAAAACFTSPFDSASCVVADGYGEKTALSFYAYEDGQLHDLNLTALGTGRAGNSLGLYYGRLCQLCGFDPWKGEEWKVMGLAPYGKVNEDFLTLLRGLLAVDGCDLVVPERAAASLAELREKHAYKRGSHYAVADLARSGQEYFCELFMALLRGLREKHAAPNLVLAGGCALNSSWNGRVIPDSGYDALHVFCAPADDGNAVGAALLAWSEDNPGKAVGRAQTPYLGTPVSAMRTHLENVLSYSGYHVRQGGGDLEQTIAADLAKGKIIGWMQGRAEFGPRALGNRSILADPRSAAMKDRINASVKFREEFRPLAPSVLADFVGDYFHHPQPSPYMERTLRFRESVADRVPAVVHVDGTGRLQTVGRDWNPRYHKLIEEFHRLTNTPMLLNTSFNVMGKPIVHSVEDAMAVFATSSLDTLVIDDVIIDKTRST